MFAQIYRHYVNGLAKMASTETVTIVQDDWENTSANNEYSSFSSSDIHAKARLLADKHRGIGVLVGILGVAIVFFAVAPTGLQVESESWLKIIGCIKVLMMCTVFVLVYRGSKSSLNPS